MKQMKYSLLVLLLTTLPNSVLNDPDLILHDYMYQLSFEKGEISGAGFEKILGEAKESSIFLIGEDHGLKEIPILTTQLFSNLIAFKYKHYATEFGSVSSQLITEQLKKKSLGAWLQQSPWTIPFLHFKEEFNLVEEVWSKGGKIWGLDQEYILSPILHLQFLKGRATNMEARNSIELLITREQGALNALIDTGNYLKLYMLSSIEKDFDQLLSLFPNDPLAAETIASLRESFSVYQAMINNDQKLSNSLRVEIMKHNFKALLDNNVKNGEKVIIKLGALHCFRQKSLTGVEEIGEYVSQLPTKSYHLLVLGETGTFNNYLPQNGLNESNKNASYEIRKRFPVDMSAFLKTLEDRQKWTYFDLRGIRTDKRLSNESIKKLAEFFDGLLIIPRVNAANNLFD